MEKITTVVLSDPAMVRSPELRYIELDPKLLGLEPHVYQLLRNDATGQFQLQVVHTKKSKGLYVKRYPVFVDSGILIV